MGHIFISYNHTDKIYAHKLQLHLLEQGFEAWIDDRIDYGADWPREIKTRLMGCDAFILIMSPNSEESVWVQNELYFAHQLKKSIFPLLLDGDKWWNVGTTQFVDVTGGKLPDTKFYVRLAEVSPRKWSAERGSGDPHLTQEDVKRESPDPRDVVSSPQNISIQVNGNVQGNLILGDGNQVQSAVGSAEKAVREKVNSKVPQKTDLENVEKPVLTTSVPPKMPKKLLRLKPEYIVAIIGSVATILAALIGVLPQSPWFPIHLAPTSTPTLRTEITDDKGVKMALIPAGTFRMGSDNGQDNEKPVHLVTLNAFYMDVYEVTNELYKACVDSGACQPPKNTDHYDSVQYANHPVVYVGWNQAQTYCMWRGPSASSGNARLPSEAEWEKAARGPSAGSGTGRTYPWGEGIDKTLANYGNTIGDTTVVDSYPRGVSPYGMFNMAGNVWEWVDDWYAAYPGNTVSNSDFGTKYRVLRGGSWDDDGSGLRVSVRYYYNPGNTGFSIGIRCARSR